HGAPMTVETDLANTLGPEVTRVAVRVLYGALIMSVPFGPDNALTVSGSRALETEHQRTTGIGDTDALANPANGFDPFASVGPLTPGTLAVVEKPDLFDQASELHEYSVQWSGSICDCGTGKIMEAIGVEYRSQTLSTSDSSSSGQYNRYNRRTKAVYAELTVPLIEQGRGEQGQSLELAAASRYEDYSDFGHVTVPRLSFHWNLPIGLEFRGSVGRSIRAPNLPDLNSSRNT